MEHNKYTTSLWVTSVWTTLLQTTNLQTTRGIFSVDNCLWRLVVYTEHDFHLILGFKLSSQTLVFTLNQDSRIGYLDRQWFSS